MTTQPPMPFAQAIKVHADAVVIRNGVPIDDDGNPLPGPAGADPAEETK